jgi:uncharacterized lipoprotein YmbA
MRSTIAIGLMFLFVGCGSSSQYLLSIDSSSIAKSSKRSTQIGIDKITVPGYMEENQIAIEKSTAEISYRSGIWAVPVAKALTQTMISSLQKRFSNPNIYLYPWDIERERGTRAKVSINRFIYSADSVQLEATYFIKRIGSRSKRSYMFSTKVPSGSDTASIVKAMNRAFSKLVDDVARHI